MRDWFIAKNRRSSDKFAKSPLRVEQYNNRTAFLLLAATYSSRDGRAEEDSEVCPSIFPLDFTDNAPRLTVRRRSRGSSASVTVDCMKLKAVVWVLGRITDLLLGRRTKTKASWRESGRQKVMRL